MYNKTCMPVVVPAFGEPLTITMKTQCTDGFAQKVICVERPPGKRNNRSKNLAHTCWFVHQLFAVLSTFPPWSRSKAPFHVQISNFELKKSTHMHPRHKISHLSLFSSPVPFLVPLVTPLMSKREESRFWQKLTSARSAFERVQSDCWFWRQLFIHLKKFEIS